MNSFFETSYDRPYHLLNKNLFFNSMDTYHTFINWIRGEFDLHLQEETSGLTIFFPEGKFHLKNKIDKEAIIAEIYLESKVLRNGQLIFTKIMSVYNHLLKTTK
ncbi:MAG: Uncharacterised protein [Polaribacter sejongensis]|nr:MAG: Uncharacterised protein [Polaribacter sejongensis]